LSFAALEPYMRINPGLFIIWIAFGLVAGYAINFFMGGELVYNLVIGVIGAVIGGYVAMPKKKS